MQKVIIQPIISMQCFVCTYFCVHDLVLMFVEIIRSPWISVYMCMKAVNQIIPSVTIEWYGVVKLKTLPFLQSYVSNLGLLAFPAVSVFLPSACQHFMSHSPAFFPVKTISAKVVDRDIAVSWLSFSLSSSAFRAISLAFTIFGEIFAYVTRRF